MARNIAVAYGPAGSHGVQSIMGIGAYAPAELDEVFIPPDIETALTRAGWISVGLWGLGVVADKPALRGVGIGGAAVAFGVKYLVPKGSTTP